MPPQRLRATLGLGGLRHVSWQALQATLPPRAFCRQKAMVFHRRAVVRVLPRRLVRSIFQPLAAGRQTLPRPQDHRACTERRLAPAGQLPTRPRRRASQRGPQPPGSRYSWGHGHTARLRARRPARRGCRGLGGHPGSPWVRLQRSFCGSYGRRRDGSLPASRPEKELPYWPICSTLVFSFGSGGSCLLARTAGSTRARVRDLNGTAQCLLLNQGNEIADNGRRHREILLRLRGFDSNFLSYQSSGYHVPILTAGFAMLSLAPVMDLDVPS